MNPMTPQIERLSRIHTDIDDRVQAIRRAHPDWPCAKGCDTCCRRLAEVPLLTGAEWDLLRDGLLALDETRRGDCLQRISALSPSGSRPIVCPVLDRDRGSCLVYRHRPTACRSYGFYVERGQGLYCKEIEARVSAGDWSAVVWGNHGVIDRQLDRLGERRGLPEWLQMQGLDLT